MAYFRLYAIVCAFLLTKIRALISYQIVVAAKFITYGANGNKLLEKKNIFKYFRAHKNVIVNSFVQGPTEGTEMNNTVE